MNYIYTYEEGLRMYQPKCGDKNNRNKNTCLNSWWYLLLPRFDTKAMYTTLAQPELDHISYSSLFIPLLSQCF